METTRSYTYEEVLLAGFDVSYWLKAAILSTANRDPVDVLRDVRALLEVAQQRCKKIVEARYLESERIITRRAPQ